MGLDSFSNETVANIEGKAAFLKLIRFIDSAATPICAGELTSWQVNERFKPRIFLVVNENSCSYLNELRRE